MDSYIKQLKNLKTFGYTLVTLSIIALLFNRVLAYPYDWVLVGIAVVGIFTGANYIGNSDNKKYKYLKEQGAQIQARVLYISLQATQTIQGPMRPGGMGGMPPPFRPPYLANFQIVCEGADPVTQVNKIYVSDNLTTRPDIKVAPNMTFRVFVDKVDSNVYWVDLSDVNFDNNFPSVSFPFAKATVKYKSYDGINYQKV